MDYLQILWTSTGTILTVFYFSLGLNEKIISSYVYFQQKIEIINSIRYWLQLLFIIKFYKFPTSELISVNDRTLSQV